MKFTWGQKVVVTSGFNCGLVGEIRGTSKLPFLERQYDVFLAARGDWFCIRESYLALARDLNKPEEKNEQGGAINE